MPFWEEVGDLEETKTKIKIKDGVYSFANEVEGNIYKARKRIEGNGDSTFFVCDKDMFPNGDPDYYWTYVSSKADETEEVEEVQNTVTVTVKEDSAIDDECGIGGYTFEATVSEKTSSSDGKIYLVSLEELKRVFGVKNAVSCKKLASFKENRSIWLFEDEVVHNNFIPEVPNTSTTDFNNAVKDGDEEVEEEYTDGSSSCYSVFEEEYTGGSSSYYTVFIENPTTEGRPQYWAECNDIIEALGMNYAEGNAFKALWRRAAARNLGVRKKGYDNGLYDSEKVEFFGHRLVVQSKEDGERGR